MMSRLPVQLSIVLPALNAGAGIIDNLKSVDNFMSTNLPEINFEIIVVAANDPERTSDFAEQSIQHFKAGQLIVVKPGKRVGKGRDVAAGFVKASGQIQLFTDGDLAIPLKNIKRAYNYLTLEDVEEKCGAVFGVRIAKHSSLVRKVVSGLGNTITRILFLTRLTDLQCGFKAFRKETAKIAFTDLKTKGWVFDVEVFAKLQNANVNVHPLKINQWRNDNDHLSGENILVASLRSLFEMIYIRFANFSFKALLRKLRLA